MRVEDGVVLLEGSVESDRADHAAVPSLHSQTAAVQLA